MFDCDVNFLLWETTTYVYILQCVENASLHKYLWTQIKLLLYWVSLFYSYTTIGTFILINKMAVD